MKILLGIILGLAVGYGAGFASGYNFSESKGTVLKCMKSNNGFNDKAYFGHLYQTLTIDDAIIAYSSLNMERPFQENKWYRFKVTEVSVNK